MLFWNKFKSYMIWDNSSAILGTPRGGRQIIVSWTPLEEGWIMANNDGYVLSNLGATCGGLLQDSNIYLRLFC